ncbi:Ig-like domain-containing protein [Bacillus safensis]|nr:MULTISPECIES: Ig-like domain-containing protein [Bacillus]WHX74128.1 Ig-like domain-containing protein [Bacillus safensis]WHX81586.1 Ig-like domain-containing protein [Bacillus safensis]
MISPSLLFFIVFLSYQTLKIFSENAALITVYNAAATRYWTDNQSVASVSSSGLVTAHSRSDATITLYKGTSVLGQVFVRVW